MPMQTAPAPEMAPEPAPVVLEPAPVAPMMPPAPEPAPMVEVPAAPAAPAASPPPAITGYVESAYHLDISKPRATVVPLRSYDMRNGNTFLLHGAHIAINHQFTPDVSATVEFDAGSDAAITSGAVSPIGAGPGYAFDVQEAYAKYSHSGFTLTAGKFVTYEGIEVIEGPMNPTLTRGYLFGLAEPYTHIGAKAHYSPDGKVDIGIGIVNGWDQWIDNNDWKTIIFRLGYADPSFFAGLSGSFGSEQPGPNSNDRLSLDLTGGVIAGDLTFNFQGNFGTEKFGTQSDNWFGVGVQPLYKKDAFSFGSRLEFFSNKQGSRALDALGMPIAKGDFLNVTLTPGVTLADHFTVRFEYRADLVLHGDSMDEPGTKKVLNGKNMQHTVGLGAHYIF
jgi:hypothetical protein